MTVGLGLCGFHQVDKELQFFRPSFIPRFAGNIPTEDFKTRRDKGVVKMAEKTDFRPINRYTSGTIEDSHRPIVITKD